MKTRTKKTICEAIAAAGFLAMLGIAGWVEHGGELLTGAMRMAAALGITGAAAWKGGMMK